MQTQFRWHEPLRIKIYFESYKSFQFVKLMTFEKYDLYFSILFYHLHNYIQVYLTKKTFLVIM